MSTSSLVARCPSCHRVTDHVEDGRLYRCATCAARTDLLATLA